MAVLCGGGPVRRGITVGLVGLAATCAAAARADGFRCSENGGAAWREVDNEHFAVLTDLSSGAARDLAREVEQIFAVLRQFVRTPPLPAGRIRLIAFAHEDDYRAFAPEGAEAYYLRDALLGPTVVMPGGLREKQRVALAHELTHHLAAIAFARQPPWYSEGLAAFMETVGLSGPDHPPTVGGVPPWHRRQVYPYQGGIAAVLTARAASTEAHAYAVAWALVHFLINARAKEFDELQRRFHDGQDPAVAWREVFPEWDPASKGKAAALDDAIGRYLAHGKFRYLSVRLPAEQPVTERSLSAAEAHAIRLTLPRPGLNEKARAAALRAEAEETLRHDPGNVAALRVEVSLGREKPLPAAERAVAAHPGDGPAWSFLAEVLPKDAAERREEALRKAVGASPGNAAMLNALAWELLETGRSGEALPLARQAASAAPWSPAVLDTLAGVLEERGQCAPALALQRRAVDILPEHAADRTRAPYLERLARLEAACGERTRESP